MIILNTGIIATNIYTYAYNSLVIFADHFGYTATIAPEFAVIYGTTLSGVALLAELTAYVAMIFPYLILGITIIVDAAVIAYVAYQSYLSSTKTLSNVSPKIFSLSN